MNSCFSYTYGYVNVDNKNLYLSHTGNNSELKALLLKGKSLSNTSKRRKILLFAFLLLGPLSLSLVVPQRLYDKMLHLAILGLLIYTAIAYWFIRKELGPRYFIPLKNIIRLEEKSNGLMIHFRNKDNQEVEQFLRKLSPKDIATIQSHLNLLRNN